MYNACRYVYCIKILKKYKVINMYVYKLYVMKKYNVMNKVEIFFKEI
jgi:hypothetical protein